MIPVKAAWQLKKGEMFRRDSGGIFKVIDEPIPVDKQPGVEQREWLMQLSSDRGTPSFWRVYDFIEVRVVDSSTIQQVDFVAIHLGSSVIRFTDHNSLIADWPALIEHASSIGEAAVHVGTVLDQNQKKVEGCVVIKEIKAVVSGTITVEMASS